MDDKGSAETEPRDGELDFSGYSEEQLKELRRHFDASRFPLNYQRLLSELESRSRLGNDLSALVRFTSADGLIGWVQAKLAWQPLYGAGRIVVQPDHVILHGWRRTWLGFPEQAELALPSSHIRNAYSDAVWVEFESKPKWWSRRRYSLLATNVEAAKTIVSRLPSDRSKWFAKQASAIQSFYRLQRSPGHRSWLVPLIVLVNFVVFGALATHMGVLVGFDGSTLIDWGAIFAPTVIAGQWWRLFTALFLHLNLPHLLVNMWVLWSAGRFTERLYGNWLFLIIYLTAGAGAGLLSVAWNPSGLSAGASGAIFGVLGAFLAYLMHGRTRIPASVMRAHFIPTGLFVIFSIFNGWVQPGIDNAAHVGGLVTGFLLGWSFAPVGQMPENRWLVWLQSAVAIILAGGFVFALCRWVLTEEARPSPADTFIKAHLWYADGETPNLRLWQSLAFQAANGSISNADLAAQFEDKIIPFWRSADIRMRAEIKNVPSDQIPFALTLSEFIRTRREWAETLVKSLHSTDPADSQAALNLVQETDKVQAHLDRLTARYSFDRMSTSIADSSPMVTFANTFWYGFQPCVPYPFLETNKVAASDAESDTPKQAMSIGCLAQHYFLTRNFSGLETLLNEAASDLGDMPDGSSGFDAIVGGLDNLISYGGLSIEQQLDRTAAWRRAIPGSLDADLVEAVILEQWGYAARGQGYANTISQQNLMLFTHRTEMADAALKALWKGGPANPLWYQLMLQVGLNRSVDASILQRIFERGQARFPHDWGIYQSMMRALMPRWGGSFAAEERFMVDQGRKEPDQKRGIEAIARLMWIYSRMEGDNVNVLEQTNMNWEALHLGLALLVKRHPRSDYLQNILGKFSCIADDKIEYMVFHSHLPQHYSASAWSPTISVKTCNKKFALN